jgi:predicted exporter
MALFSSVGMVAAMLTVVCWFPLLDRGRVKENRFAQALGASLERWPRFAWPRSRVTRGLLILPGVVMLIGLARLSINDDVRQMQSSPPVLMQSQIRLSRLLGLPSPAQFYLVQGRDAEEVLQREEALKERLDKIPSISYSALSDWIPSQRRQQADAALTAQAEAPVLQGIGKALGETLHRPAFAAGPLTFEHWLASPASTAARALWLGRLGELKSGRDASVVLLHGLSDKALLPPLAAAVQGLEGVRWVDKAGEISALLARYRLAMSVLLLLAHAAVFAALAWRFGRQAWRAWLPTAAGSLATLALLGWLGEPLQLFNVLALLLLLGVGVDYGIFLLEHRASDAEARSAWLAVALGSASTWLSFGLLGLSGTPALHAFGLTLMIGLALVVLLAPCLRLPVASSHPPHPH